MTILIGDFVLRRPEPKDIAHLYGYRNDPDVMGHLGGFSVGYAFEDLGDWLAFHRNRNDEVLWVIADRPDDRCIGHVGLYQIDYRIGKAEYAIMIGDKTMWNRGIGHLVTKTVVEYGFKQLNLHRISLEVLATNERALHLYQKIGFQQEGVLRDCQYKNGNYIDVIMMSILEAEW
jgi:RimJ/RimL family protein N-acetyltransferase